MRETDVLIVGGGPAGLTAAIYARRAGLSALVLEKMFPGGQMTTTSDIDNYPGLPGTNGFDLSQSMAGQAKGLGTEIVSVEVTGFSLTPGDLQVQTASGVFKGKAVILAMGARRRTLDIPGEQKFSGRGVSYCATCDGAFTRNLDTVVVGGGNTALEDALYLSGICKSVTLVHRRDEFRGGKLLEERVRRTDNIHLKLGYIPVEITGETSVTGLIVRTAAGGEPETLPAAAVFIAVGTVPETALLGDALPLTADGRILASEDTLTPIPGVFAAGDIRSKPLYQIVTAAADGAVAASKAVEFLC